MRPSSPRSSRISSTTARYSRSSSRVRLAAGTASGLASTSTRSTPSGSVAAAPGTARCSGITETATPRPGTRTRSETSASTPTFAYVLSCRGTSSTRASLPTSAVNVTAMPGNTTVSSSGMILSLFIVPSAYDYLLIMSTIYLRTSTIYLVNYNRRDDEDRRCVPGVAVADALLLRAARAPAGVGRTVRAVAGPVPPAPSHRARPAAADAPPRRGAAVRCVERHRPDRSPRAARNRGAPPVARRPTRESGSADADRLTAPGAIAAPDDGAAAAAVASWRARAPRAGQDARAAARGRAGVRTGYAPRKARRRISLRSTRDSLWSEVSTPPMAAADPFPLAPRTR